VGLRPHGNNFLLTILRLGRVRDELRIVDDQIGAPTTSLALSEATQEIVAGVLSGRFGETESWSGLYHMTCGGSVSWCAFAREILARAAPLMDGKMPAVTPIASDQYPSLAARPRNSVLSCGKLDERFGSRLPHWQTALLPVLETIGLLAAGRPVRQDL
jgi:dTDP-4-dehydrorhamnose reductase